MGEVGTGNRVNRRLEVGIQKKESGADEMRERLYRFMQGRNGVDELTRAELLLVFLLLVLAFFFRPVNALALIVMVHTYYRVLSRNRSRRYEENRRWMAFRYRMTARSFKYRKRWNERGLYKYFRCPQCRQEVRVPAHRGRICITCPRCRQEFMRRTGSKPKV